MYKPPENMNRVKAMRSKFENNATAATSSVKTQLNTVPSKKKIETSKSVAGGSLTPEAKRSGHPILNRQHSDPVKRNIKRTPAFRLDKSTALQENTFIHTNARNRYVDNKIKLFDSRLKETNCDNEENICNNINRSHTASPKTNRKLRLNSIESGSVTALRNKFSYNSRNNSDISSTDASTDDEHLPNDEIKLLYAKPIPKALRTKPDSCSTNSDSDTNIHEAATLKLSNRFLKNRFPNIDEDSNKHTSNICLLNDNKNKFESTSNVNMNDENGKILKEIQDIIGSKTNLGNDLNITSFKENKNNLTNLNIEDSYITRRRGSLPRSKYNGFESHGATSFSCNPIGDLTIEAKLSTLEKRMQASGFTDTIKRALTKPLPPGPAPKKPPRTFIHLPKAEDSVHSKESSPTIEKSIAHLNLDEKFKKRLNSNLEKNKAGSNGMPPKSTPRNKGDAKYMLDKLENALRNNKIRLKKVAKVDTSEEECDDEKLDADGKKTLSNLYTTSPSTSGGSQKFINLNCLTSTLDCTKTNSVYERVIEPNSNFFVECSDEPVYAIPFAFTSDVPSKLDETVIEVDGRSKRNSLYYMSSPVLNVSGPQLDDSSTSDKMKLNNQLISKSEVSSISTSDTESAASTPTDDFKKPDPRKNIRDIIKAFENATSVTNSTSNSPKQPVETQNGIPSTQERLQVLQEQIRQTLDRSFKNNNDMKKHGSSSETDNSGDYRTTVKTRKKDEIVDKFETYVRTVRVFSDAEKVCKDKHLFTCCLLVGLMGKTPYIKSKFPPDVEIPPNMEDLCFPDVVGGPMDDSNTAQCYSLVITKESGDRIYGYCRRVIPEGSRHCLPLVYCILSKYRAPRFYRKILENIESRHGLPDKVRDLLLNEFYNKCFPNPGHMVKFDLSKVKACIESNNSVNRINCDNNANNKLNEGENVLDGRLSTNGELDLNSFVIVGKQGEYGTLNTVKNNSLGRFGKTIDGVQLRKSCSSPTIYDDSEDPTEISLRLHQDIRYEETDLEDLCNLMSMSTLKKVFASLLLERKVILVSCILSQLSSCIEALQSILYPFSWPHTLIPVLPQTLWEVVEAPTPLICGCLSSAIVNNYEIENGIVIDLDQPDILQEVGDEDKILPSALVKTWTKGMSMARHIPKEESARNVFLSDAFLRVFVDSCGHYKQFIIDGKFLKEEFIDYPQAKGVRRFLKWFTETTMFYMFIDSVISNTSSFPIFDKRIQIYNSPESDAILEKMKDWK